jgi:CIC family chloride channel protein
MGWFVPQALGVGYVYVGAALNNTMAFKLMALLVALKLFAVTISYASGNAGGIFGPSLFLGAMLGGSIGSVAHHYLPGYTASPGAYALVGMGALFAGIVRAPMTSVLMIFEMTRDYSVIVPLMIANLASLFISSRFQKQPIYEALAHQDGIHLPTIKERSRIGRRTVALIMRNATEFLPAEMSVQQAVESVRASKFRAWPLMD